MSIGSEITQLLINQGTIAANRAQQQGQIVGQTIQNVGQQVGGAVQQAFSPQAEEYRRTVAGRKALAEAIKSTPAKADGTPDYQAVATKITPQFPDIGEAWLKTASNNQENLAKLDKLKTDALQAGQDYQAHQMATIGDAAFHAKSANEFTAAVGLLATHGQLGRTPQENEQRAAGILQQADAAGPNGWDLARQQYLQFSPEWKKQQEERNKPVTLPRPGSSIVIPATGQTLASSPLAPEKPVSVAPGATLVNPQTGASVYTAPPAAAPLQSKSMLLDGKPAELMVNPKTGKWEDLNSQEITNAASRIKPIPPQANVTIAQNASDAKQIADAIVAGDQPPDVKGLFRLAGPVRAELAKQGYDMTKANLDWEATKKHLATLNGAQQTRLRQAIGTASDSLDVIQTLADKWDAGRFPLLNKANLALAKNGAYGKEAASIATQLEGQITDVTSELGNVYMGGNSPTDHALQLAGKNLSANWDRKVLTDMIKLARTNLQIRQNSITNAGAVTQSGQDAAGQKKANDPMGIR